MTTQEYIQKEAKNIFLKTYPEAPVYEEETRNQDEYWAGLKNGLSAGIEIAKEFAVWLHAVYKGRGEVNELFEIFLTERNEK